MTTPQVTTRFPRGCTIRSSGCAWRGPRKSGGPRLRAIAKVRHRRARRIPVSGPPGRRSRRHCARHTKVEVPVLQDLQRGARGARHGLRRGCRESACCSGATAAMIFWVAEEGAAWPRLPEPLDGFITPKPYTPPPVAQSRSDRRFCNGTVCFSLVPACE
jgi:hypothetical protein